MSIITSLDIQNGAMIWSNSDTISTSFDTFHDIFIMSVRVATTTLQKQLLFFFKKCHHS